MLSRVNWGLLGAIMFCVAFWYFVIGWVRAEWNKPKPDHISIRFNMPKCHKLLDRTTECRLDVLPEHRHGQ